MFAAPDDSPADEGAGIAEDRRARILRRMLYPALALAAAGVIAWLGGCSPAEAPDAIDSSAGAETLDDLLAASGVVVPLKDWGETGEITVGRVAETPGVAGFVRLDGRGYVQSPAYYGPGFTLAYEYRFPNAPDMPEGERPNCNTGCLLFITGEDKVWPRCLEVQGKWSETASIKSNARDVEVTSTLDEPARDAARKPPGAWNRVEIVSRGGALTVSLNGVEVATSEPTELIRGRIGFQAEGFPVEFRDVRIEE